MFLDYKNQCNQEENVILEMSFDDIQRSHVQSACLSALWLLH